MIEIRLLKCGVCKLAQGAALRFPETVAACNVPTYFGRLTVEFSTILLSMLLQRGYYALAT